MNTERLVEKRVKISYAIRSLLQEFGVVPSGDLVQNYFDLQQKAMETGVSRKELHERVCKYLNRE